MQFVARLLAAIALAAALLGPAHAAAPAPARPAVTCEQHPCVPVGGIVGEIKGDVAVKTAAFLAQAQAAGADAVVLAIASPGGSFGTSRDLFDVIKASKVPVYCYVAGMAASGAFWALQACTERVVEPDAKLMTHQAYLTVSAPASFTRADLLAIAANIEAMNERMCGDIAARMGITLAALMERIGDQDWFLTVPQAVLLGAADRAWLTGIDGYVTDVKTRHATPPPQK